ncbi:MAG: single-stranded DNA-binding protein [Rikenellaceae bacterium]|nr:single-stranded DNA-binding protein [Rikenellaceae bacterium]
MVNKVILIGNVGQDPDVRSLDGGVKVARIRLATTERIYNQATKENKDHTEWHTITLWRGLADVADRYIRKGSQIYVEGRIRTREWTDRDNQKRTGVEILADELKLLGRRNDAPAQGQYSGGGNMGAGNSIIEPATHSSSYTAPEPKAPSVDNDLPF